MQLLVLGYVKISRNEVAFQYGLVIQYGLNTSESEIYRWNFSQILIIKNEPNIL